MKKSVYTIGYQSRSLQDFLALALKNGIQRIIDVRKNPISRKPGFSKRRLSEAAAEVGIEYLHVGQLGIESSKRKNLRTEEDYHRLLDEYEESITNGLLSEVKKVASLASEKPSALMCFEANPSICHRSRIAKTISERFHMKSEHLLAE